MHILDANRRNVPVAALARLCSGAGIIAIIGTNLAHGNGRYGPLPIPFCFHHGIPLTNGDGDVPLVVAWLGIPDDGCAPRPGGGGIGTLTLRHLAEFRRDPPRFLYQDRPVPGMDRVK
jgi:hypothetical protein